MEPEINYKPFSNFFGQLGTKYFVIGSSLHDS